MLDNKHSFILECFESFSEYVLIIIRSSSCLSSFEASIQHCLLRAVQENNKWHLYFCFHHLVPHIQILFISWKSVYQKSTILPSFFLHGLLKQRNCNLTRDNLTLINVFFNQSSILRSLFFSFGSQQITCGEMVKFKFVMNLLALCAFARAWASKYKDNSWTFVHDMLSKNIIINILKQFIECINRGKEYKQIRQRMRRQQNIFNFLQKHSNLMLKRVNISLYIIYMSSSKKQAVKPKKLHNRFDEWEVLSIFVQSTNEYLNGRFTSVNYKFYIRCILGLLMGINAYLSHFGPWVWPHNFYFLIFSVVFFAIGSHFYTKLGDIPAGQGNKVGEFIVDGIKTIYAFKLTPGRIQYILEEIESQTKQVKRKKSFDYLEYFTEQGDFLEGKYGKHLEGFMASRKK